MWAHFYHKGDEIGTCFLFNARSLWFKKNPKGMYFLKKIFLQKHVVYNYYKKFNFHYL